MYHNAVIIGSGSMPAKIAKILSDKQLACQVIETANLGIFNLKQLCDRAHIPYIKADKSQMVSRLLEISEPTLVISAANNFLFPKEVTNSKNLFIVNYHSSFLPNHPGRNAEAWAIFENDPYTGVTWHRVDSEIDHGNILIQGKIALDHKITSIQLLSKQSKLAKQLFEKIADSLIAGTAVETKMTTQDERRIHYSFETPNDGLLNPSWPVPKISCFLRAMDYKPLNVFHAPVLSVDGQIYTWKGYKIYPNSNHAKTDIKRGIFADESSCIELCDFCLNRNNQK